MRISSFASESKENPRSLSSSCIEETPMSKTIPSNLATFFSANNFLLSENFPHKKTKRSPNFFCKFSANFFTDSSRSTAKTLQFADSMQLSIDGDGRVIMPENLLKKVKIKNDLIFVGKGSTFEIWEPKKFNEYMLKAKKDAKTKRNVLKATK